MTGRHSWAHSGHWLPNAPGAKRDLVVGSVEPKTLAIVASQKRESLNRPELRGEVSTTPDTDLLIAQVNNSSNMGLLSNQPNNSPTRKGGPESPCTNNGCADSISIVCREQVEYSTLCYQHVKYSTLTFKNDNLSKASTVLNINDNNSSANTF